MISPGHDAASQIAPCLQNKKAVGICAYGYMRNSSFFVNHIQFTKQVPVLLGGTVIAEISDGILDGILDGIKTLPAPSMGKKHML